MPDRRRPCWTAPSAVGNPSARGGVAPDAGREGRGINGGAPGAGGVERRTTGLGLSRAELWEACLLRRILALQHPRILKQHLILEINRAGRIFPKGRLRGARDPGHVRPGAVHLGGLAHPKTETEKITIQIVIYLYFLQHTINLLALFRRAI